MTPDQEVKLFLLDPVAEYEEYERVTNQFVLTLPTAYILKIERVQNKTLWKKYCNRSKIMKSQLREYLLFHGTRHNNPEAIYRGEDGFDIRLSSVGMWGRGNYFAVNSSYSDAYAFHTNRVRKMFAAWVLTGNSVYRGPDNTLTKPPPIEDNPAGGSSTDIQRHYDTVNGSTGGTRVYITYENDYAYPAYLITYKIN